MGFRATAVTVVALALAACGGGPTASASPASASPSPSARSATTCRLPVFNWGPVTNGNTFTTAGKNGFLSLPAGTFSPDPAGVLLYDETTFVTSTQQTPTLDGDNSSGSFDAPRGRWVPAARPNVLPDGSAYVYEVELRDGSGYDIHLVDVMTARDVVIYHMPYDNGYQILRFELGSVYVYPILHRSGLPTGLWRLDIATRTLSPVPNSMGMTWEAVASGVAWGGPGGAAGDSLYSLALDSGVLTKWFQHPVQGAVFEGFGYGMSLLAFDRSGHPLVQVYPPPPGATSSQTQPVTPEIWVVNAPGNASQLSGLPIPDSGVSAGVTDAQGTWIVGADGVYLYTQAGFRRMAGLPPQPMPNYTLAGPCA
jgi:hypothetical protein